MNKSRVFPTSPYNKRYIWESDAFVLRTASHRSGLVARDITPVLALLSFSQKIPLDPSGKKHFANWIILSPSIGTVFIIQLYVTYIDLSLYWIITINIKTN